MNNDDLLEILDERDNQEYVSFLADVWGMSEEDVIAELYDEAQEARYFNRNYMGDR